MLTARIVGVESVSVNLGRIPARVEGQVRKTIAGITLEILRKVKAEKLSGQVLNVRTGTLRRSINQRMTESAFGIAGSVGTKLSYARRWEQGFSGTESVKAHLRKVKQAWGRDLRTPVSAQVRAFTRRVDVRARPFLRPVLDAMRDDIRIRIEAAIRGGIR